MPRRAGKKALGDIASALPRGSASYVERTFEIFGVERALEIFGAGGGGAGGCEMWWDECECMTPVPLFQESVECRNLDAPILVTDHITETDDNVELKGAWA